MPDISLIGGDAIATLDNVRHGLRSVPVAIVQGGIDFAGGLQYVHKISDVQSLAPWTIEFTGERDHFEGGSSLLTIFDGVKFSTTLELEGDALAEAASLIGQDLAVNPNIEFGKIHTNACHILIISIDSSTEKNITSALLVRDVDVKLDKIPGVANNATENYTLTLTSRSRGWRVYGGHCPSFEIFSDNGVNPAAPDGIITDFKLGDGNNSYDTPLAGAVAIKIIDPDAASNLYKYFYYVKLNGVDVSPNDATYNVGTHTITFNTAPANNAVLEIGYCVDKSGSPGVPAHLWSGSDQRLNWKGFQV